MLLEYDDSNELTVLCFQSLFSRVRPPAVLQAIIQAHLAVPLETAQLVAAYPGKYFFDCDQKNVLSKLKADINGHARVYQF